MLFVEEAVFLGSLNYFYMRLFVLQVSHNCSFYLCCFPQAKLCNLYYK